MSKGIIHAIVRRRSSLYRALGALTVGMFALVALLAFTAGGAVQMVPVDPDIPGQLVALATTVDLGRVPLGVRAEARFDLVNPGADTVQLTGAPRVRMLEGC